ncbi:MAG: SDR family NAD(P)-dependent oxidoreductase, partial [Acidimicrobiales bacterium]|nr:SDR family NAD(P)-dependent oxidoreductase [Acidimicrobiales bacterium]
SIGPGARRRLFDWPALESFSLNGQTVVITGGTSGIGEVGAEIMASLGANLVIVARDQAKADATVDRIKATTGNPNVSYVLADLGKQENVRAAAAELAERHQVIHTLIHNAGVLFPERRRAESGADLAIEIKVAAPFLLTGLLLPQLKAAKPGRVLTMSSGGMYTQPLSVSGLEMPDEDYGGAVQYALAKRAQVVLSEMWATRIDPTEIVFHSLHPGWVDTPGVSEALPTFSKVLGPLQLLRSPREGADTMVWLAASDRALETTGEFWHDREVRPTHKIPTTKGSDTPERRKRLWEWCEAHTGFTFEG